MSKYTPTTDEVRTVYVWTHTRNFDSYQVGRPLASEQKHYGDEFDRWLNRVKAEAWEECATKIEMQGTIKPGALAEIIMPKGYVIDPATKRESAEEAAHDYMRRNIGPSVGTIADRLEIAFLAGAHWALATTRKEQE